MIYQLVAVDGNKKTFEQFTRMYKTEVLQEEQRRIGRSLVAFDNNALFKKGLDFVLSPHVRSQDAPLFLALSYTNPITRNISWKWLQKNWKTLHGLYHGDHLLPRIINPLGTFQTTAKAKEIERFFKVNPAPSAQRAIKQVIEQIDQQVAWLKRDSKDVAAFLNEQKKESLRK